MTFNAPIINEDPDFPAVRHFPKAFVKYDEIYQPKDWSRDKVNVLLSLDPSKLDYNNNPRIHRTDHDFAVDGTKCTARDVSFTPHWVILKRHGKTLIFARCILKLLSGRSE
jgi:hypothetical protein